MTYPILRLTDGTEILDLISPTSGFHLSEWTPVIPDVKGGGIFQSSPLTDGRRIAMRKWDNIIDTFALKINGDSQDAVIRDTQKMRRLLLKANDYWITDWQSQPVWVEARGSCETNTRYGLIVDWRAQTDDNPYAQPLFSSRPVMDDFTLILEHEIWKDHKPGESDCVQISSLQEWNAITGANLVINPGFETAGGGGADVFANWTEDETGGGDIRDETINVFAGSHACNIFTWFDTYQREARITTQNIAVTASTPYVLNFLYDCAGAVSEGEMRQYWVYDVTNSVYIAYDLSMPAVTGYTQVIRPFTTPAGCVNIQIAFRCYAPLTPEGYEILWIDEVSVKLAQSTTYLMGRAATCDNEVYVANKQNIANLTRIYSYDAAPVAWSANLMNAALPYSMFPAVPANGDIMYFGIETAATQDSGPFCSLVFDIGTAAVGMACIWEYYSSAGGGTWVVLTVCDNTGTAIAGTASFTRTGVNSIHWLEPTTWVVGAVNGITGYWIRCIITALTTRPTQQNRDVYTINYPFVEIDELQTQGDIPALARIRCENVSDAGAGGIRIFTSRVFMGLRSLDRGAYFTPYLNCADEQNTPGITVALGTDTTFASIPFSPTGRYAIFTPAASPAAWAARVTFAFSTGLAQQYTGVFRALLRCRQGGGNSGDMGLRLYTITGAKVTQVGITKYPQITPATFIEVVDFGQINIPSQAELSQDAWTSFSIAIYGNDTAVAPGGSISFFDLILMPVDEWAGEYQDPSGTGSGLARAGTGDREFLDVNAISYPKNKQSATERTMSQAYLVSTWKPIANGPPILQVGKDQRLWFYQGIYDVTSNLFVDRFECAMRVRVSKVQRYLGMRGDR